MFLIKNNVQRLEKFFRLTLKLFHECLTTFHKNSFQLIMIHKHQIGKSLLALNAYKSQLSCLNSKQMQIAVGVLLGDASIQSQNNGETYRLKFEQSNKHKHYLFHLYEIFEIWVLSEPKLYKRMNSYENEILSYRFQTISHKAFKPLADIFLNKENKKHIRMNLITDYLTPLSLAYWFMDDGGRLDYNANGGKGIIFNTQGFTFTEVEKLSKLLNHKFHLTCWVKTNKKKPVLAISGKDYEKLVQLIKPLIISSMLFKFPSERKTKKLMT